MSGDGDGQTRSAERRYVDLEVASVGGVGAQQEVAARTHGHGERLEGPSPYDVWRQVPGAESDASTTYYDRPVLKEPVWIWSVPAYFYVGGAAGAAALLGAVADATGDLDRLVQRCRWIATIGTTVGTGLLVADLGRPERLLNMLRVFRPTSPMSVGSWILAGTAGASTVALAAGRRDGPLGALGRLAGSVAGALGMPLAGYTAVLVSNTAIPAWQHARRALPLMFQASGALSAAALLDLPRGLDDRERQVVRWYAIAGAVGELAMGELLEREAAGTVERVAEPYQEGTSGALLRAGKAATGSSLLLWALPGSSRLRRIVAGLLGTLGSLCMRFGIFEAGRASARDPRAALEAQRAGHGAAEVTGRAAVTGPRDRRATDP